MTYKSMLAGAVAMIGVGAMSTAASAQTFDSLFQDGLNILDDTSIEFWLDQGTPGVVDTGDRFIAFLTLQLVNGTNVPPPEITAVFGAEVASVVGGVPSVAPGTVTFTPIDLGGATGLQTAVSDISTTLGLGLAPLPVTATSNPYGFVFENNGAPAVTGDISDGGESFAQVYGETTAGTLRMVIGDDGLDDQFTALLELAPSAAAPNTPLGGLFGVAPELSITEEFLANTDFPIPGGEIFAPFNIISGAFTVAPFFPGAGCLTAPIGGALAGSTLVCTNSGVIRDDFDFSLNADVIPEPGTLALLGTGLLGLGFAARRRQQKKAA